MPRAEHAIVSWENEKNRCEICVKVGQSIIKRVLCGDGSDISESLLRTKALEAVKSEGYDIEARRIDIRGCPSGGDQECAAPGVAISAR